jgi:hypothetical protein
MVEHLSSKYEVLTSNPVLQKKGEILILVEKQVSELYNL